MNHLYRSIWNESLQTWVAAPETGKARGKRQKLSRSVRRSLASAGLVFSLAAIPQAVLAACNQTDQSSGVAVPTGEDCTAAQSSYSGTLSATGSGSKLTISDPTPSITVSNSVGIHAVNGGVIDGSSSSPTVVVSSGTTSGQKPVYAEGSGSLITLQGVTLTPTNVNNTNAIAARVGGTVTIKGDTLINSPAGGSYISSVYAVGGNSTINLGTNTVIHHRGVPAGGAGIAAETGFNTVTAAGPVSIDTLGTPGIAVIDSAR